MKLTQLHKLLLPKVDDANSVSSIIKHLFLAPNQLYSRF